MHLLEDGPKFLAEMGWHKVSPAGSEKVRSVCRSHSGPYLPSASPELQVWTRHDYGLVVNLVKDNKMRQFLFLVFIIWSTGCASVNENRSPAADTALSLESCRLKYESAFKTVVNAQENLLNEDRIKGTALEINLKPIDLAVKANLDPRRMDSVYACKNLAAELRISVLDLRLSLLEFPQTIDNKILQHLFDGPGYARTLATADETLRDIIFSNPLDYRRPGSM
jgi:hypothetical protein